MKRLTLAATLTAIATLGTVFTIGQSDAQQAGFRRTELQRGDLSVAGREVVVARAELDPDGIIGRHTHPGEESSYILEGTVVLEVDGKPAQTLKTGDVFLIPMGVVHAAKNVGGTPAKVIATYIVEKGKPLASPAK